MSYVCANAVAEWPLLEVLMSHTSRVRIAHPIAQIFRRRWVLPSIALSLLLIVPAIAAAQSPFDTGFTAMQSLFTGTIAKVASLIAIVVGGYQFAHGEPGAKKIAAF
jgi:type IV secretion system protein VirB2